MNEFVDRLVERADDEGILDVAYATLDTPLGKALVAGTPRGLVRVALPNEEVDRVVAERFERLRRGGEDLARPIRIARHEDLAHAGQAHDERIAALSLARLEEALRIAREGERFEDRGATRARRRHRMAVMGPTRARARRAGPS